MGRILDARVDRAVAVEIERALGARAFNSSHGVWLLPGAELRFFVTRGGWIFAFRRVAGVTLIALEPLPPECRDQDLASAWEEFARETGARRTVFAGIGEAFARELSELGFDSLRVGREPWVALDEFDIGGKRSKGVRAARNQAIRAGLTVEERASPRELAAEMNEVFERWRDRRALRMDGFLNTCDPAASIAGRRWFIARASSGRMEGFLVATPIGAGGRWFLEDLVLREDAERGCGELLTTEALLALGAGEASLGVVSCVDVELSSGAKGPLWGVVSGIVRGVYRSGGLELFRKRFNPYRWSPVHLAVGPGPVRATDWLRALVAMACAFRPRLRLRPSMLAAPLLKRPVATALLSLMAAPFLLINRCGALPHWALERYGFSASSPVREWLVRTWTSDLLHSTPLEFWLSFAAIAILALWAERTRPRGFLVTFLLAFAFFDDFLSTLLIRKPSALIHLHLRAWLLHHHEVGSSLLIAALLGLQTWKLRPSVRGPIVVALLTAATIGVGIFNGPRVELILSLDVFLCWALGYGVGFVVYELARRRDQRASKGRVVPRIREEAVVGR